MDRKLLYYPHTSLRDQTHEVNEFNYDLVSLAETMRQIMKDNNGMGLAANQVGDRRKVIIVEYPGDEENDEPAIPFTILANPKITSSSNETDLLSEGCLSLPAIEIEIKRAKNITVTAQSASGQPLKIKAKGIFARILQHEIDHLNGKLIIDYAPKITLPGALKAVVWGSTHFTTQLLNALMTNPKLAVSHVVTESPKPSGRGREVKTTIVHTYAETLGIPCLEPHTLTDERFLSYLKAQHPDVFIVAAYGKLLPPEVLAIPRLGSLNVHPSLLPLYRGATPIQAAILNGDTKTGVTVIRMLPEFDTGDIVAQSEITLDGTETYGDLEPMMAELGGEMIREILIPYEQKRLEPMPQNHTLASYTKKITAHDRWLNPQDPAKFNERKIRAFAPTPSAFVIIDGQHVKILSGHLENHELVFDLVQPAGKRPMVWQDFLRGYRRTITFDTLERPI